jgi:hypothetical protein
MKFEEGQLKFNLEGFDEVEDDAEERAISNEEARKISEVARQALGQGKELPAWWLDYLHLIEQGWPWRVACYIAWAASPKKFRKPANLDGFG